MAFDTTIISTRTEPADPQALMAAFRVLLPEPALLGVSYLMSAIYNPTYVLSKATAWTPTQIAAAQNAVDTAPTKSLQLTAQSEIDAWPLSTKALVLTLIDQLNVLRAFHSLPAVTPAQALTAIRNKAGTL